MSLAGHSTGGARYLAAVEHLVDTVQHLSTARDLGTVMRIVRQAARRLTGADGATFVLSDDGMCFYADEDAISPLWKGHRFPQDACISGWAMIHRTPAIIEDIYADDRIPHDAYRPTFVKSLAMVPIRTIDPIGAIGAYWAERHAPTEHEVHLLCALADSTAVAMENIRLVDELETRVEARTAELQRTNDELDSAVHTLREFVAVAAHDLQGPLTALSGAANILSHPDIDESVRESVLTLIAHQTTHLSTLVNDLFTITVADAGRITVSPEIVNLRDAVVHSCEEAAGQAVRIDVDPGLFVFADVGHLQRIVSNLVRNAVRHGAAPITVTAEPIEATVDVRVSDVGPQVPHDLIPRLFHRFTRGSSSGEGAGLGLSIVAELARLNGGSARYTTDPVKSFVVTLPSA